MPQKRDERFNAGMNNEKVEQFDLQFGKRLPWWFGFGCLVVALTLALGLESVATAMSLLTAVGGTAVFLYGKHSQDVGLFRQLFREFNDRYGKLNDRLDEIRNRQKGEPLKDADQRILFAYFNLCAEEYMYYAAGYIYAPVWEAWLNGMRYFDQDPEIHDFWKRELQQNSYYGFVLDCPCEANDQQKLEILAKHVEIMRNEFVKTKARLNALETMIPRDILQPY
jgi:hypothetical protein